MMNNDFPVTTPGVDEKNSTNTAIKTGVPFTGTWRDRRSAEVIICLSADQDIHYRIEQSVDGQDSTIDSTLSFIYRAGVPEQPKKIVITRKYYRIIAENNTGVDCTYTRLQTSVGSFPALNSPLNSAIGLDDSALTVRNTVAEDEIVLNLRRSIFSYTKFAHSKSLTASAGEETIWPASGNFTPMTTASTFTIAYNNSTDGAAGGTNGAKTLFFNYIDSSGKPQVGNHTLGSTGSDVTSFTGLGINRIAVSSSGSSQFNINDITITETTGATIQASIPAEESVTQQAIYFVGSDAQAVGKTVFVNTQKLSGGGAPRLVIKGYVFNRNIQTRLEVFREVIDTNAENSVQYLEPAGFRLSPTDVLYFVADTDTNAAIVNLRFSLVEYTNE